MAVHERNPTRAVMVGARLIPDSDGSTIRITRHVNDANALVDAVLPFVEEHPCFGWPWINEIGHFMINAKRGVENVGAAILTANPHIHRHTANGGLVFVARTFPNTCVFTAVRPQNAVLDVIAT